MTFDNFGCRLLVAGVSSRYAFNDSGFRSVRLFILYFNQDERGIRR
jgi:hypothetical protein